MCVQSQSEGTHITVPMLQYTGTMTTRHTKRHSDLLTTKCPAIARQLSVLSLHRIAHINKRKSSAYSSLRSNSYLCSQNICTIHMKSPFKS